MELYEILRLVKKFRTFMELHNGYDGTGQLWLSLRLGHWSVGYTTAQCRGLRE